MMTYSAPLSPSCAACRPACTGRSDNCRDRPSPGRPCCRRKPSDTLPSMGPAGRGRAVWWIELELLALQSRRHDGVPLAFPVGIFRDIGGVRAAHCADQGGQCEGANRDSIPHDDPPGMTINRDWRFIRASMQDTPPARHREWRHYRHREARATGPCLGDGARCNLARLNRRRAGALYRHRRRIAQAWTDEARRAHETIARPPTRIPPTQI